MKKPDKKINKKFRAFSLIEVAIVITIMAILTLGIFRGGSLLSTFRVGVAQSLTQSSPVNTIKGLSLWLETTMSDSFVNIGEQLAALDGDTQLQLTQWNDRNPQATSKYFAITSASSAITYKEVSDIYSLPAIYFDGSVASASLKLSTKSSPNYVSIITPNNAFTFFIVAKLDSANITNAAAFMNGNENSDGWSYFASLQQRRMTFAGVASYATTATNVSNAPEVISATYAGGTNGAIKLFTNGVQETTFNGSTVTALTPVSSTFYIGNKSTGSPWKGYICEIIIFNRALSDKERNQVEQYLGQKYNIQVAS